MFVLGLTGSIGMGKSAAARMFRRLGVPVYDADAAVHRLMAKGGAAVSRVEAAFPGVVRDGAVDRKALGARVFGKPDELRRLERIVHPMVALAQRRFLAAAARRRHRLVVLDVPLLFETGGEARTDAIAVVSAPARLQRARVLARPGMTEDKLAGVLRQQAPDSIKRQRADFIIPSGLGFRNSLRKVAEIVTICSKRQGHVWPPRRRPARRPARHPSRRPVHARNRPRH
jgi:dephospho-CoA kinase